MSSEAIWQARARDLETVIFREYARACPGWVYAGAEEAVVAMAGALIGQRGAAAERDQLRALVADLERREKALVLGLKTYGEHLSDCDTELAAWGSPCSCGLDELAMAKGGRTEFQSSMYDSLTRPGGREE